MSEQQHNNEGAAVLGVITARGGSKELPGKNITPLAGKPLLAWTIEAAQNAVSIDHLIISTDDQEIADCAESLGVEVPFIRPAELAQDDSPHVDVLIHAVESLTESMKRTWDYILLLQPTTPLRTAADIDAAVSLAVESDADSVIGVCSASSHPFLVKKVDEAGHLSDFVETPPGYLRRQDLPAAYAINGAIYLVKTEVLLTQRTWLTENSIAYVMPVERSIDIDNSWDLKLAESAIENSGN